MRASIRFPKLNSKVQQVVSDTGVELFTRSIRNDKPNLKNLEDASYVFEKAENASILLYLYSFPNVPSFYFGNKRASVDAATNY